MNKGKKYIESAKLIDKATIYEPAKLPVQSSTKQLKSMSVSALTPVTQISRYAEPLYFLTEPVKMCVCLSSAREIT